MKRLRVAAVALAACMSVSAGGCGPTYYRVTDPTTGHAYYTTDLDEQRSGGVRLRDAGTGNTVTLQNSEVEVVNKETFESGKARQAVMPGGEAP